MVDLCYVEDSQAAVDFNCVMNGNGNLIEVQGTGRVGPSPRRRTEAAPALRQGLPGSWLHWRKKSFGGIGMKVVLASKNPHKLVEISAILKPLDVELVLESDLGVDVEGGGDGEHLRRELLPQGKRREEGHGPSGSGGRLWHCSGRPGGRSWGDSARYGDDPALDDWGRLLLLLKNTEQVPDGQRQAQFVSVITLVYPDGRVIQARGEAHGELLREAHGEGGFGYDPIFTIPLRARPLRS